MNDKTLMMALGVGAVAFAGWMLMRQRSATPTSEGSNGLSTFFQGHDDNAADEQMSSSERRRRNTRAVFGGLLSGLGQALSTPPAS